MLRLSLISLILITAYAILPAQKLVLLKQIAEDINSHSGLGQSFAGHTMATGDLFFRGSADGLYDEMWKTDGTPEGTVKLFEETSFNQWEILMFIDEGIFISDGANNKLVWFDAATEQTTELADIGSRTFLQQSRAGDNMIFLVNNDGTAELWTSDWTESGTRFLGEAGTYSDFLTLYASAYGAVVYNENAFIDYEPVFYDPIADSVRLIKDFVTPGGEIEHVRTAYLYDRYLIMQTEEGGFVYNRLFNLDTQELTNFLYTEEVYDFIPHGENLFILTRTQIIRFTPGDGTMAELTEDAYPLGTHLIHGDSLFFIGEVSFNMTDIRILDMNTEEITILPESAIGVNNYNCALEVFQNALFYTYRDGLSIFLHRYDYDSGAPVLVDTTAVENGSYTIGNCVADVNGTLVVSRYKLGLGHELHYLDFSSGLFDLPAAPEMLVVWPNPAQSMIHVAGLQKGDHVRLINAAGQILPITASQDGMLSLDRLVPGHYRGILEREDGVYGFAFVKEY